ncbi:hypothetical protein J6590_040802 [Homalodisca vitripennis]|nr:hypothetical protein J6590_040802 [Homalodisca vitripennis]
MDPRISTFAIPGFDLLSQPRADNQLGGVIINVDSDLHYKHQLISLRKAEATLSIELLQIDDRLNSDIVNHEKNLKRVKTNTSEVRAKKPTQPGDQRLKGDFRITTNGRTDGLLARIGSVTGHPSKQQPCSTLLDSVVLS